MEPAPRQPRAKTVGSGRWACTAETQLLDAARGMFVEKGFTHASIADVVQRAGSSVGSLYHHFGRKSELFSAGASIPRGQLAAQDLVMLFMVEAPGNRRLCARPPGALFRQ